MRRASGIKSKPEADLSNRGLDPFLKLESSTCLALIPNVNFSSSIYVYVLTANVISFSVNRARALNLAVYEGNTPRARVTTIRKTYSSIIGEAKRNAGTLVRIRPVACSRAAWRPARLR